ncbi:MAG: RecQ family zinc-binding domain-containing protein, partial [Bacteroidetes bacterium]|nr:RecQ family zinc-binding domain-containing protein [Bacteroidota bacterium]
RFKERVSAMLNYAENNAACRSMMLLDYFGEKVTTRCGNCDYCRNRNKLELNDLEFERIRQIIKEWVNAGKITYSDINNKFPASQQRNYLHALQWLMDTEVIMFDEKQFLIWNE